MATLTAKQRKDLPKTVFGDPANRSYPMPDKAHAINAKARATQQADKGNLSSTLLAKIRAKAATILGGKRG